LKLPRNLPRGRRLQPYSRVDAPYFRSPGFFVRVGGLAVLIAMYAPQGLWGLVSERFDLRLFPVGYWLHGDDAHTEGFFGRLRRLVGRD